MNRDSAMQEGVSIVLCCHNSAKRLPDALAFLAAQNTPVGLPWEVIVVDNCSTDGTAGVASQLWQGRRSVPLRVVRENTPGLAHARRRGFEEARHGFVIYVDDDNWLAPDWVRVASETLSNHPEVGCCGGQTEAICEVPMPSWFEAHQSSYAVGCQAPDAGDVTWTRGFLWGAGLAARREALARLFDRGFRPALTDRSGRELTSGGDTELCLALRLAGWRLYYDPALRLRHHLPAGRLIGLDVPSVDRTDSKTLPLHHALGEAKITILENLDLREVQPGIYELIALPLRLVGADGSPVRAVLVASG
jgi:glycosyltransferase involved in cell wall biosynthesis